MDLLVICLMTVGAVGPVLWVILSTTGGSGLTWTGRRKKPRRPT